MLSWVGMVLAPEVTFANRPDLEVDQSAWEASQLLGVVIPAAQLNARGPGTHVLITGSGVLGTNIPITAPHASK